jgi:molybdate transport system permease protein
MSHRRSTSPLLGALAVLAVLFVMSPLLSVVIRVPWNDFWSTLTSSAVRQSLFISLQTSLVAAVIAAILGIPLSWWLARTSSRLARIIRTVCIAPMVLPPVVAGIALLAAFGRRGVVGEQMYNWWSVSLPFTKTAVILAQVFVAMPFLILAVEAAFRQANEGLEDAARTMGASPLRIFFTVVVPSVRPALVAGLVLAWARSFGEFGASITFAGSFPGRTQTLPMSVYEIATYDYRQALVVSVFMMIVSVGVLAVMRDRWATGATR